jgi:protein LTV1
MVKNKKGNDKSKEYHFHLVSRSLADPLADQPGEGQSVLQPYVKQNDKKKNRGPDEAPGTALGLGEDLFGFHENLNDEEREKLQGIAYGDGVTRKSEEAMSALDATDCYFPMDGYNYEQHLRLMGTGAGKFFAAAGPGQQTDEGADEEDRSRLRPEERAALEALDHADAYEDGDDDFFGDLIGDGEEAQQVAREAAFGDYLDDSDDDDEEFDDDEPRPKPSGEMDAAFDMLLGEYDDDQLGPLDCLDDIDVAGSQRIEAFDFLIDEHIETNPLRLQQEKYKDEMLQPEKGQRYDYDDEPAPLVERTVRCAPEFDCESVLSLRSNLSNHPGKLKHPEKPKRNRAAKKEQLEDLDEDNAVDLPEVSTFRPKCETPEERKERKAAVKEHQRLCRAMKKETKEAFKAEAKKAHAKPNAGDLRDGVRHRPL